MLVSLHIASGNNLPVRVPDYAPDFPSLGEFQIALLWHSEYLPVISSMLLHSITEPAQTI